LTECPNCGAPAERGQLVCTECGTRIALKEEGGDRRRRRLDNAPAIAVLLTVVVIGAAAFGFALSELTDDSGNDSAAADNPQAQPPPTTETDTGKAQRPSHSLLLTWPKGLTAYTVVLLSTGDRPGAQRVARQAARSGLEAGLLRSDDFNLGQGYWIVFAGRFDTQASAEQQASNLASRYPGAYATQVKPSG
jgi:predicted nucleic acid-binding Zn ribbon protein